MRKCKCEIGEISYNNQNLQMKVIGYRNSMDIDIQFEDGTIVKNRTYDSFKKRCYKK